MRPDIHKEITTRLQANFGLQASGQWLNSGKCPQCQKRELYAAANNPWVVKCGRLNKCGYEAKIRDLFPDIFANFNQRYKSTKAKPTTTADTYLEIARGLDPAKLKGWYTQGHFEHPHGDHSTATVRFAIAKDVTMERLIEPVTTTDPDTGEKNTRKAQFRGSFKGKVWTPPRFTVKDGDEIWIVEGCLDAAALSLAGIKAVACLTCYNYPTELFKKYAGKKVRWIWALDNDPTGREYLVKGVKRGRDEGLDVVPTCIATRRGKIDWNDAWQQGLLNEDFFADCRYHGALLTAESALQKAQCIWARYESKGFCLDFNNRTYWFSTAELEKSLQNEGKKLADLEDAEKVMWVAQMGVLMKIANCRLTFLYFLSSPQTDESWYYCRVDFPHKSQPIKNTFTGAQIASSGELKKRLLSIAPGAVFRGNNNQLDWLIETHLQGIKTVETVDFIGYSGKHKTYVFDQIAINNGRVIPINAEDFFEVGKTSLKSLNKSFALTVGDQREYVADWPEQLWAAYGSHGLVAAAFWLGTLFVEQIRAQQQSFPFLEIVGEPGSGKTGLIEFLWKLLGRANEEGFDPCKSTAAAIARKFSQVSNLPVVLIESDREQDSASRFKRFDWDDLKTAYNGRASRVRGVKNTGLETYEPPFRGAIVISQNADVQASDAILQRLVHLKFDKSGHSQEGKKASDALNGYDVEFLSFFLIKAITSEREILDTFREMQPKYERHLLAFEELHSHRIAKNHAQILAVADGLFDLIDLDDERRKQVRGFVKHMAIAHQNALAADHPIIAEFWEIYDYLESLPEARKLNHSHDPALIAIRVQEFVDVARQYNQQVPLSIELKRLFETSKTRRFVAYKSVNSQYVKNRVKCWVFAKESSNVR